MLWPNGTFALGNVNLRCGPMLGIMPGSSLACGARKALVDNPIYPPQASVPEGMAPYAFNLPVAPGGMAADAPDSVRSESTVTGAMQSASVMGSTMTSANTLSAELGVIINLAANMLSSCTVSADAKLGLNLAANLASQGQITAALGALANCACDMLSANEIDADLKGVVRMEASMSTAGGVLTVDDIVRGVWNALAASFNTPGTMGAKVNAAGSASNPWTDPTGAQVAAFVERIKKLMEADEIHTATTVEKREAGTATVLLTKNHTGTPLTNLEVTEP